MRQQENTKETEAQILKRSKRILFLSLNNDKN